MKLAAMKVFTNGTANTKILRPTSINIATQRLCWMVTTESPNMRMHDKEYFVKLTVTVLAIIGVVQITPFKVVVAASPDSVQFVCQPTKVYRGERVTLTMSSPHGGDLLVFTPNKESIFILTSDQKAISSLPSGKEFKEMKSLILETNNARGMWEGERKLIFTKSGWYSFHLGENLETENPVSYNCKVYFRNRTKH